VHTVAHIRRLLCVFAQALVDALHKFSIYYDLNGIGSETGNVKLMHIMLKKDIAEVVRVPVSPTCGSNIYTVHHRNPITRNTMENSFWFRHVALKRYSHEIKRRFCCFNCIARNFQLSPWVLKILKFFISIFKKCISLCSIIHGHVAKISYWTELLLRGSVVKR
jgi:hypothetical protein